MSEEKWNAARVEFNRRRALSPDDSHHYKSMFDYLKV